MQQERYEFPSFILSVNVEAYLSSALFMGNQRESQNQIGSVEFEFHAEVNTEFLFNAQRNNTKLDKLILAQCATIILLNPRITTDLLLLSF